MSEWLSLQTKKWRMIEMKLKTLKEIKTLSVGEFGLDREELRAEAILWAEHYKKAIRKGFNEVQISYCEGHYNFIYQFFNLTEEDLK